MTTRTSKRTVTFKRSFCLHGLDEALPPGEYLVETDEELLEGLSFPAYRRKQTLIHLHVNPRMPGCWQALPINPDDLDAALRHDQTADESPNGIDERQGSETRK